MFSFLRTVLTWLTQLLKSSQTMMEAPVRSGLNGGQVHERLSPLCFLTMSLKWSKKNFENPGMSWTQACQFFSSIPYWMWYLCPFKYLGNNVPRTLCMCNSLSYSHPASPQQTVSSWMSLKSPYSPVPSISLGRALKEHTASVVFIQVLT